MSRLIIIAATLLAFALAAPSTQASDLGQRSPHHGHHVAGVGTWHHGAGFHHPWGFRGPGFGFAPFLPVVALPPPVVAVPVQVAVPVPQYVPAYAPPQVNYAPALPSASSCGCPTSP